MVIGLRMGVQILAVAVCQKNGRSMREVVIPSTILAGLRIGQLEWIALTSCTKDYRFRCYNRAVFGERLDVYHMLDTGVRLQERGTAFVRLALSALL